MPSSAGSEEHTSELQSPCNLVCRLLLERKTSRLTARDHLPIRRPTPLTPDLRLHKRTVARHCIYELSVAMSCPYTLLLFFFFFNDTAPPEIYTLSLHGALPIYQAGAGSAINDTIREVGGALDFPDRVI